MTRHVGLILLLFACLPGKNSTAAERPNILWIVVEDMSANFGCYGETAIKTPHVDRLAAQGIQFTNAIVTAPVCSTCRSALVTGMYQTSLGAHHHRSGRGEMKIQLPTGIIPVPQLFGQAGYHVNNISTEEFVRSSKDVARRPQVRKGKTDYNFEWDASMYSKTHWAARKPGTPFFCQIQPRGGKLRGKGNEQKWPSKVTAVLGNRTDPAGVKLPPYLPDDPVIQEDWAQYLDTCRYTDWEVGKILDRLKESGDLKNTFVFFITDHGISHVRNKQFMYEGGVHIPFIVRGPGLKPAVRDDVVEHIDLAATSLALAGLPVPGWMQSRNVLVSDYQTRRFAFSARDRCDETVDRMRCVRSQRYKYIRNFFPQRPYLQPNRYKDNKPIIKKMRELFAAGKLNDAQSKIMALTRPEVEVYDLEKDPFELNNLAGQRSVAKIQREMHDALAAWIMTTNDKGQQPEGAMYDSDMAIYSRKKTTPEMAKELRDNIATMKQWQSEGK